MTAILSACRPMCGNTSENSSPDCPCLRNRNADLSRLPVSRSDRKSTRLNSSHSQISYAVFCLKKKNRNFDSAWRFLSSFEHRRPRLQRIQSLLSSIPDCCSVNSRVLQVYTADRYYTHSIGCLI